MKVEKGTRYRVTEIRVLLSLFLYFDIITIIIRQLGIEILLLLTIAREIGFSLCLLFFSFQLCAWYRTTEKDGDDGHDLSLIELYTCFPLCFRYVKFDSRFLDLSFYLHIAHMCGSRAPRKSYSNFMFLLAPFPLFFTYTSALSSFRRRRVRGLILSISFLHLRVQPYRGKIKLV